MNGKGLRRRLSEQKLFVIVTESERSSGSWPGKKTCSWLVIVLVMGNFYLSGTPETSK
jgi:hypothetical protein